MGSYLQRGSAPPEAQAWRPRVGGNIRASGGLEGAAQGGRRWREGSHEENGFLYQKMNPLEGSQAQRVSTGEMKEWFELSFVKLFQVFSSSTSIYVYITNVYFKLM